MQYWQFGTKPVIGLTGGIGSGKSFVASLLKQLGCGVIDSDRFSRQALSDPEICSQIKNIWGDTLFLDDGRLNRQAMAQRVFTSPNQLKQLEQIIHPYVHKLRTVNRKQMLENPAIIAVVEDCPLLYETGLDSEVDVTIFIAVETKIRLSRVHLTRGWSELELIKREKNQLKLDTKAKYADYVINNNGSEKECSDQISLVLSKILQSPDNKSEIIN
ncbi:MAG: dephospho-CoA kinase [Phycisphaeraceae bacterium]|nr:dephospho-CoA kinase [Phycisphaeraceae bacterium]